MDDLIEDVVDDTDYGYDNEQQEIAVLKALMQNYEACNSRNAVRVREYVREWVLLSDNPFSLITEIIQNSLELECPEKYDIGIDILSTLEPFIQMYGEAYLAITAPRGLGNVSIQKHNLIAYRPNPEYWYVLLRALGRCTACKGRSLRIISACQDCEIQVIAEAVVEALGDLDIPEAKKTIQHIIGTSSNEFIKKLANQILQECV
jgi:hypothetical protein